MRYGNIKPTSPSLKILHIHLPAATLGGDFVGDVTAITRLLVFNFGGNVFEKNLFDTIFIDLE